MEDKALKILSSLQKKYQTPQYFGKKNQGLIPGLTYVY